MVTEPLGVVRVARQVLITIGECSVTDSARSGRFPTKTNGRALLLWELPTWGSLDQRYAGPQMCIVGSLAIVETGIAIQEEVASAIEEMVGMLVREVNVYSRCRLSWLLLMYRMKVRSLKYVNQGGTVTIEVAPSTKSLRKDAHWDLVISADDCIEHSRI
jgi:hypothetical protein